MQLPFTVLSLLICYIGVSYVNSLAVMSVDLGSEWMKVGIVSPGVPMEIALNKESKRKTPAVISFRDNIRLFGEDAQTIGVRFPKLAFSYLLDLLGKNIDHPIVQLYKQRFPYYDIIEDTERKTILFKIDEETTFSVEELVAQLLGKAKEFAETGAQQPIKECVLTVPGFFNQVERKALLQAAELAGLKVLQLINDYTAVALNFGIFRSKTFNETAHYVMFYDMGASSTTATLVSYQTVKAKDKPYVEINPQATILGVGFDRTLGGLEMQIRLRNYLATKFNDMKKTKNDVFKNDRAMAKLFKEAGRLKNVLSANAEHIAQIENLLDEQDFKLRITREEMEELFTDLFERVGKPVEQALKAAHLTMDVVSQVVLVGAGTRVPKVQEYIKKAVGQELSKNLNTDEAAAMGAVYKAADLSTGFKVAKFITKDAVLYPIQVTFERIADDGVKQVKRTLFGLMNPYPQKKIITFNKHTTDFSFNVNYSDLDHLTKEELENLGNTQISKYSLKGVAEVLNKNVGDNVETKGIKAHFAMDDSGILNFVNAELVIEKTVLPSDEEEGTLSKLGSTFSKLFGGEEKPAEEKPTEAPSEEKQTEEATDEKLVEEKEESKERAAKDAPKPPSNETAKQATEKVKEVKPKIVTLKEPIVSVEQQLGIAILNRKQLEKSEEKISALDKIDREINRRSTALNNLESFVIDMQNKLEEEEYIVATTPEEREKISAACSQTSEWIYDEGSDANADTYEKKIEELMELSKDILARVFEHKERPEALNALNSLLNHSSTFLLSAKNATKDNPDRDIFTDVEVQTLEKIIKETEEWKDKMVKEQEATPKNEPVKLSIKAMMDKMGALDREVKYLLNKAKLWKPKKVEKPVKEEEIPVTEEERLVKEEKNNTENIEIDTVEENDETEPSKSEDSDNHLEL